MSIRNKLLILTSLLFFSLATITGLSLWNWKRLQSLNETILQGQRLQTHSRNVMGLMKDIIFDLFAPHMYSQIRSLTYAPRSIAAYKTWLEAVDQYQMTFMDFIDDRDLNIMQDDELQDLYKTALTLNQKALNKLYYMSEILGRLQNLEAGEKGLYVLMQKDETLIPFFDEFRDTSFYFTNTFESFMNHFYRSFREQSKRQERELYILFILTSLLMGGIALIYALIISRQIVQKINLAGTAFKNISMGDFSTTYPVEDNDELSTLLSRINSLSSDLKGNINSILNLARDMGVSLEDGTSLENLTDLITETIIKDTSAEVAAIYLFDPLKNQFKLESSRGSQSSLVPSLEATTPLGLKLKRGEPLVSPLDEMASLKESLVLNEPYPQDILALPLIHRGECRGFIVALIMSEKTIFSDLGITRMINFSEYVSLTLDNHMKYREVLEKREAQYWALQSQVQPHFIYNILSGFIGLNRMGDTKRLETAILSLREMLRYVTDQNHWTTMEKEFEFLGHYCDLQKIRFSQRLNYKLDLPEDLNKIPIPRLLLQPLVENSVIHGLEPQEAGGRLTVKAERYILSGQGRLVITVSDDGCGYNMTLMEKRESVGMRNVTERLKMAFPGSEFITRSSPGEGTTITITIPEPEDALQ
ncbi:histidine kinase [Oceanispirochaeta sp.]|jgi:signal transduction histidine kinase|uniref:sensor histidine kinase n=1 Tax=Oceanispirochaeta sp. TaxID=2035350 RepID=UPI00260EB1FE|nr:histidine kinase [Oceanispirochaeta sp.]MDA3957310.1 histidine kinase [Oceanispirochaeta sp.]